jgi:magnesium-protoporphyrin O-methyltransferase
VSCGCDAVEREFDRVVAERDLKRFRSRGPDATTQKMLAAIQEAPRSMDGTLLDIGGGIGVVHHLLLERGYARAAHVDGSSAYLEVAAAEARRRGHVERVTFHYGNFHALAATVPAADLVTLDRVVCCDPDGVGLLAAAASHARRLLAFSFPRARWYNRAVVTLENLWCRLRGRWFRAYVHDPAAMTAALERAGLRRRWSGGNWIWSVELFERMGA